LDDYLLKKYVLLLCSDFTPVLSTFHTTDPFFKGEGEAMVVGE
jgi:hypothetical protein